MIIGKFWRNTEDSDVQKNLKFFTEINTSRINDLIKNEKNINNLKILLANQCTKILHGEKSAKDSELNRKRYF